MLIENLLIVWMHGPTRLAKHHEGYGIHHNNAIYETALPEAFGLFYEKFDYRKVCINRSNMFIYSLFFYLV